MYIPFTYTLYVKEGTVLYFSSFYPVILVKDTSACAQFFIQHFGFSSTFTSQWYMSLENDGSELALLSHNHETIPDNFRNHTTGLILNFEVEDAELEFSRLVHNEHCVVKLPLKDEDFGQRHFILEGPEGILIDVIQNIAPSSTFIENYSS